MAIVMATLVVTTIVEKYRGAQFVSEYVYGSWWFVLLWAVFAFFSLAWIVRSRLHRRPVAFLIHVSFLFILLGALITFCFAERGEVHLRCDTPVEVYMNESGEVRQLPFVLTLADFSVVNYPGTSSPMDYRSRIGVKDLDGENRDSVRVSMNNIASVSGYRFFQLSYDEDGEGTHLGVSHDPWGIGITYFGYCLLFLSMILFMFSKQTKMRYYYRKATEALVVVCLLLLPVKVHAAETVPQVAPSAISDSIGSLCVLYNNRICPLNTLATDFVTKLSGRSSWRGLFANQIFTGWMFYFSDWEEAPIIRIKDAYVRELLGIDGQWASFSDFWDEYNEYKLSKPLAAEYASGKRSSHLKGLREADEKFNLVRMFYSGELLKLFPYPVDGKLQWFAPAARHMPADMPQEEWFFIRRAMDCVTEYLLMGNVQEAQAFISKIHRYQQKRASDVLPSNSMLQAEILYNRLASVRVPIFIFLTLGIVFFFAYCIGLVRRRPLLPSWVPTSCNLVLFLFLTVLLALRWFVSGHVPLSNGFEIMQFMAWSVLLFTFILQRSFPLLLGFATMLSGFVLLVALLGESNPQITSLMPVLHSPLLSLHVMVIMFSYALFAMLFFLSITYFIISLRSHDSQVDERLTPLSRFLLYPAIFLLTAGIFIGAVWANQSWGRYWGWDPKEVWALITMMVYALPMHSASFPQFQRPRFYHAYMLVAFLTILMTYFGVNFFLGGMHSYA